MRLNQVIELLTNLKLQRLCRSKDQINTQLAGDPLIPGSVLTFDQVLRLNLENDCQIQAFLENLKTEKVANMSAASSFGDKVKACGVHFSKLPQHRRGKI
jgi:hypothetical protein